MSKSSLHSVTGIAKWAKVFEFNRDRGEFHKEYDGAYTIQVYLEESEMKKHSASGSRAKPKIDDDGVYVQYRRKHINSVIPALGGAPKVVDANDEPWDSDNLIGNGSKVEVFFTVYDSKMGKGTRLEGIRVLDPVEFEGTGEGGGVRLPF
jgi:hypothetical protein